MTMDAAIQALIQAHEKAVEVAHWPVWDATSDKGRYDWEAASQLWSSGERAGVIAARLGCCTSAVYRHAKVNHWPPRGSGGTGLPIGVRTRTKKKMVQRRCQACLGITVVELHANPPCGRCGTVECRV